MDTTTEWTDTQVASVFAALGSLTMERLFGAVLLAVVGIAVVRVVMRVCTRMVGRLPVDRAVSGFLLSALKVVLGLVLATMVADKLGIPVTSLVALISLFALAVSLSLQNVLANVVSGIVILLAKPFAVGDYIETDSGSGTVQVIELMYTHLLSPDNKLLLVPNSELSAERITNYSSMPVRRVDARVLVGYEHENQRVLAALLRAAARATEGYVCEKPPFAAVNAYTDSGVEFVVRVYVPNAAYWDVYHALLLAVRESLAEDGIALTYGATRVRVDAPDAQTAARRE